MQGRHKIKIDDGGKRERKKHIDGMSIVRNETYTE